MSSAAEKLLQEGLCHGICAVSYLSKLEQGKVQAADEIYQALFHRLGIAFQEQPEWLTVWKEKLQELAAAWFYEEQSEAFELEEQMERLLNSPLCVDALLIKALYEKEQAETTLASASVFLPICRMINGFYIIFYVRDRHFKQRKHTRFQRYSPSCRKHRNMEAGVFYIRKRDMCMLVWETTRRLCITI